MQAPGAPIHLLLCTVDMFLSREQHPAAADSPVPAGARGGEPENHENSGQTFEIQWRRESGRGRESGIVAGGGEGRRQSSYMTL